MTRCATSPAVQAGEDVKSDYALTDLGADGWSVYNRKTRDDVRFRGPNARREAESYFAVKTGRVSHAQWAEALDKEAAANG